MMKLNRIIVGKEKVLYRVKADVMMSWCRQTAALLEVGIPLIQSLHLLAHEQSNPNLSLLLLTLKRSLEGGLSFAESIAEHDTVFEPFLRHLIQLGEEAGRLPFILYEMANYLERVTLVRRKLVNALTYPAILTMIAIIILVLFMVYVIPQFAMLYQSVGTELPAMTRIILIVSSFIQCHWLKLFVVLVMTIIGMLSQGRRLLYFLPVIGDSQKKIILARFCRTIALGYTAGLPILKTLQLIQPTLSQHVYRYACSKTITLIQQGQSLGAALSKSRRFPSLLTHMITVGETSGTLDMMLKKSALYYEEEIERTLSRMNSLLEPTIMAVLGVFIGFLIIALYLPMFKLGSVL